TFRFTISADGGTLTITTAKAHKRQGTLTDKARPQPDLPAAPEAEPLQPVAEATPSHRRYISGGTGDRETETEAFYRLLDDLGRRVGGKGYLRDCTGHSDWPRKGVYFFYEDGEDRANGVPRVVRVGTHALTAKGKATLWGRLRQHRGRLAGRNPGGG